MKLDLDADNVFEEYMSLDQARNYFETGQLPSDVQTKLDEAQGYVHQGNGSAFLVIKIEK